MTRGNPMSSSQLDGIIIDLNYFLEESGIFEVVKIKKTGEPWSMVEIKCKIVLGAISSQEIIATLEQAWRKVQYQHFEAHIILRKDKNFQLDFIIEVADADVYLYVTGNITVNNT